MGEGTDYRPLKGVKVVELSTIVAAGSYSRILADWGTEATKMESAGGDMFRSFPETSFVPCTMDENPLFDNLNTGKKGIVLSLKTLGGIDTMHKLLADMDILLADTRPRALECLRLDYASLKEVYPKLIMANVNGSRGKEPKRDNSGFDMVAFWASSGFNADMIMDGPNNYPVCSFAGPGGIVTAIGLCYAITATPYKRNRTELGDHISSSLYDTALWCFHIMTVATEKQYSYTYPKTHENSAPARAPSRTKDDGWMVTTILQIEKQ